MTDHLKPLIDTTAKLCAQHPQPHMRAVGVLVEAGFIEFAERAQKLCQERDLNPKDYTRAFLILFAQEICSRTNVTARSNIDLFAQLVGSAVAEEIKSTLKNMERAK